MTITPFCWDSFIYSLFIYYLAKNRQRAEHKTKKITAADSLILLYSRGTLSSIIAHLLLGIFPSTHKAPRVYNFQYPRSKKPVVQISLAILLQKITNISSLLTVFAQIKILHFILFINGLLICQM